MIRRLLLDLVLDPMLAFIFVVMLLCFYALATESVP